MIDGLVIASFVLFVLLAGAWIVLPGDFCRGELDRV